MALEYHTVNFTNDGQGIAQKNAYTNQMSAQGWRVAGEAIEPGHLKGGEACCGFVLCAPLAFLAGRTSGIIVTTFAREYALCPYCGVHLPIDAVFCRNCGKALAGSAPATGKRVCPTCGAHVELTTAFCPNCGTKLSPVSTDMPQSDGGTS